MNDLLLKESTYSMLEMEVRDSNHSSGQARLWNYIVLMNDLLLKFSKNFRELLLYDSEICVCSAADGTVVRKMHCVRQSGKSTCCMWWRLVLQQYHIGAARV